MGRFPARPDADECPFRSGVPANGNPNGGRRGVSRSWALAVISIRRLLAARRRHWTGKRPATEAEIAALQKAVRFKLPSRYVQLLRASNGGEGELALEPLWFQLFDTTFAAEMARDDFNRRNFEGFFFRQ